MEFNSRESTGLTLKRCLQDTKYFYMYDVVFDKTYVGYADIVVFEAKSPFDAYIGKKKAENRKEVDAYHYFYLTEDFLSKYRVVTLIRTAPDIIRIDAVHINEFEKTVRYFNKLFGYIPKHNYYLSGYFTWEAKKKTEKYEYIDWCYYINIQKYCFSLCT